MTKSSRSIKRAWKRAGKPSSLKQFARTMAVEGDDNAPRWLSNKAKQRRATTHRGHKSVYTAKHSRSTQHLAGRAIPSKGDN